MSCPLCTQKITYQNVGLVDNTCGPCERQLKQLVAGFRGVISEAKPVKATWNNTPAYQDWVSQLTDADKEPVRLIKKGEYVDLRCDIRDMKRICGLPKFLALEKQVFTAWILEGTKDEKMQELLGLTYSQLIHIKKVVQSRLQKQMAYYLQIKQLEREGKK